MSNHDEALVEKAARALAGIEPGEDWPTNEALGGGLTGTRDDEYRDAMRVTAIELLDAVADDLRADGWDRGYDAASTCHCAAYNEDECGCGYYGNEPVYRDENPYRRERA